MTTNTDDSWVSLSDYLNAGDEYYWYDLSADLHDDYPEAESDTDEYPNVMEDQ